LCIQRKNKKRKINKIYCNCDSNDYDDDDNGVMIGKRNHIFIAVFKTDSEGGEREIIPNVSVIADRIIAA
jgi:hypothetical protein